MAYHIYTTKGFILSSRPSREADKIYSILTEELGLVHARGRGVRLEKSKLRGALEPYSLSTVSLVRGQDIWRITGSTLEESLSRDVLGKELHLAFGRILSLIERLVAGEESHKELYFVLEEALQYVLRERNVEAGPFEVIIVLRILYLLGYVSSQDVKEEYLSTPLSSPLFEDAEGDKKALIELINLGLKSSHLV
jgi:DNA repair protein RecO (recombination protein O)